MIKCDKCNAQTIIFQKYSGMHLCRTHFDNDVHRKIRETLRETRIFGRRGARIAIALSGDIDSSVLLHILKNLFNKRRDIEITAILVDEGISGYRSESLQAAKNLADDLQVHLISRSFKEAFQITMDEIASQKQSQTLCTFCRALKDALLNRIALDIGADVLATGHNLDDEAQAIMFNYLRGDIFGQFGLQSQIMQAVMVQRIKPLRRVPEKEIALYAKTHGLFPIRPGSCPYIRDPMRLEVKRTLNNFEERHPGTKYSLLRSLERIMELGPESRIIEHEAGAKPLSGGGE